MGLNLHLYVKYIGAVLAAVGLILLLGAMGHELGTGTGHEAEGATIGVGFALVFIGIGVLEGFTDRWFEK